MTIHAESPWPHDHPETIIKAIAAAARDALPWIHQAACRGADPDLFFPARGETNREAITICRRCPVRQACLDHAITHNEHWGIWGGATDRDRRRIRRARAQARRTP